MSTHPYIPLYVDDYDAATAHLTPAQDGVYGRLMRLCWRTPGCSLPSDEAWIARKVRLSTSEWERVGKPVLEEFFTPFRGRLIQKRLKAEYDDISRKKSARVAAGKKGGTAKARKTQPKSASNATVLPQHTGAFPEPEPDPEPNTPPHSSASAQVWSERLAEAKTAGGSGIDLTSPALHTYRDLKGLCEPQSGEPCEWGEVLDAIRFEATKAAAKGKPIRTWTWVAERAVTFRDRRLAGMPAPRAVIDARPKSSPVAEWPDSRWAMAVEMWRTDGSWGASMGPQPGAPGCRVPPQLLIEAKADRGAA